MGCTYSEEVDPGSLKSVSSVPVLINQDDLTIVGRSLPPESPTESLHGELCLELHPVAWFGARPQSGYTCMSSIQGVALGHFELFPDRSSVIVFPITSRALDALSITLTFLEGQTMAIGSIAFNVPQCGMEQDPLRLECTQNIIADTGMLSPTPEMDAPNVALTANATVSNKGPLGRVALTITVLPHRTGELLVGQRLRMQHHDPNESSSDSMCASLTLGSPERQDSRIDTSGRRVPLKSLMAGIRQSVGDEGQVPVKLPLPSSDFGRDASRKVLLDNGSLEMKVFAPRIFASIRALDEITTAMYQREWDLPEDKLRLDLGAGRSGSLFLRSNTNRFILKTIPHAEVCTFLSLLEDYHNHLVVQPDSFIMHVHGLYRFWWSTTWLYVILFSNILHSEPALPVQIFDLKGRVAKPGKLMQRRNEKGIVWKDKDLERFFFLPEEANARYRQQLKQDVAFLEAHNMMDYSLLVGVRERPENIAIGNSTDRSFFRSFMGGIPGTSQCSEVYYIGIIDCLTQYNSKKKVANFCKTFLWNNNTLSTVPSKDYSTRFLNFMFAIFPTEQEVRSAGELKHPNLNRPIAPLDTLILNPNQVASPMLLHTRLSANEFSTSNDQTDDEAGAQAASTTTAMA